MMNKCNRWEPHLDPDTPSELVVGVFFPLHHLVQQYDDDHHNEKYMDEEEEDSTMMTIILTTKNTWVKLTTII